METYYKLTIDALCQALSDIMSAGEIDIPSINESILSLNKEIDRRIVNNEEIDTICQLRKTLEWVKYDLVGNNQ